MARVGKYMRPGYVECPGCERGYELHVPSTPTWVTRFGCAYCGAALIIKLDTVGDVIVTRVEDHEAAERQHFARSGPRQFPIPWSPKAVVRIVPPNNRYQNEPWTDAGSDPDRRFTGYIKADHSRLPLLLADQQVDAEWWTDVSCRCSGCHKLLEQITWPRSLVAGREPLLGLVVADISLMSRTDLMDRLDKAVRHGGLAVVALLCRSCKVESVFFLRGHGLAVPAMTLDKAQQSMEHLFE